MLGTIAWLISMAILSLFMDPVSAVIFSPIVFFVIVVIFFSVTGMQYKLKMKRVEDEFVQTKRKYPRYHVNHYPAKVKMPDGTKLDVILIDVSFQGFQILCTDSTAQRIYSQFDKLMNKMSSHIELTASIPLDEHIENIVADCKLAYINKDRIKEEETEMDCAVGLSVIIS